MLWLAGAGQYKFLSAAKEITHRADDSKKSAKWRVGGKKKKKKRKEEEEEEGEGEMRRKWGEEERKTPSPSRKGGAIGERKNRTNAKSKAKVFFYVPQKTFMPLIFSSSILSFPFLYIARLWFSTGKMVNASLHWWTYVLIKVCQRRSETHTHTNTETWWKIIQLAQLTECLP